MKRILDNADVIKRYMDGESGVSIARSYKVEPGSVYICLQKNGIPRRSMSGAGGQTKSDYIYQLRECGWTYQQIGDKLGITKERVRQILNAGGLPYKKRTKWRSDRMATAVYAFFKVKVGTPKFPQEYNRFVRPSMAKLDTLHEYYSNMVAAVDAMRDTLKQIQDEEAEDLRKGETI